MSDQQVRAPPLPATPPPPQPVPPRHASLLCARRGRRPAPNQRVYACARASSLCARPPLRWRVHAATRCPRVTAPSARQGPVEETPAAEEAPAAEAAETAEAAEAPAEAEKKPADNEPADEAATSPKKSPAKSKTEKPGADAAEAKSPAKKARAEKKKREEDDNDDGDASPDKICETANVRSEPALSGATPWRVRPERPRLTSARRVVCTARRGT